MGKVKINVQVMMDWTPPQPGESREAVLRRCVVGSGDLIFLMGARAKVLDQADVRANIIVFLKSMQAFLGPDIPSKFTQARAEWQAKYGDLNGPSDS